MKLSKKMICVLCLLFVIIFSSSSENIVYNSNLSLIKSSNEQINQTEKTDHKEEVSDEDIKKLEEIELENKRKLNVTYNRSDITLISYIKEEELKNVLVNYTGASTMAHLSGALVEAEIRYGVNAFTMAAIVALESGFATSRRAIEDNNLTGYEVYSDDSEGRLFSSQEESILQTARHLSKNYLTKGGTYYNGVSVDAVQVSYCPDEGKGKNWEGKVDKLASGFLKVYKELYM